jgi:hypothetical protein
MESERNKEKVIVNDLTYKTTIDYKNGSETIWEYKCNHKIESFKPNELLIKPPSEDSVELANKVCLQIRKDLKGSVTITEQQEVFYKDCTQIIFNPLNISAPILVPVKCGFGKSSFIKSYIATVLHEALEGKCGFEKVPMIISTDRIEDLKEIQTNIQKEFGYYDATWLFGTEGIDPPDDSTPYVYVMESWNKEIECSMGVQSYEQSLRICNQTMCDTYSSCKLSNQKEEQIHSPIVAVTNKRLAILLDQEDPEKGIGSLQIFCDKHGKEIRRNLLIIDEKPAVVDPKRFSIETTSKIVGAINKRVCMTDEEKSERTIMDDEANRIEQLLREIKKEFSNQKTSYIIPKNDGYSDEFVKLWHKHFRSLYFEKIMAINDFLNYGGLYCNNKKTEFFITTRRNRLNTNGIKTFVFDGTAELSMEYSGQNVDFVFLNIDDYKDFGNLTFKVIDINFTKSAIIEAIPSGQKERESKENPLVEVMGKWINNNIKEPTYVISYSEVDTGRGKVLVNSIITKELKSNNNVVLDVKNGKKIVPYFGNTKGKNKWSKCANMVQAGWNRYPQEEYFARFFTTNEQIKIRVTEKYDEVKYKQEVLFNSEYGQFILPDLEIYRLFLMTVDLEQEVYRTSIRNFGETDKPVTIYLFKASDPLRDILKQRFKGCHIENVGSVPEFQEYKILFRKGNDDVKRLIEWVDSDFLINGNSKNGAKNIPIRDIKKKFDIKHTRWNYIINEYEELFKARRLKQSSYNKKECLIKY